MEVHSDTGNFGRCLSATLHLGGPGEEAVVEGGEFRTHRCREGDCLAFGWRYDKAAGRPPDRTLLRAENLETVAEVPYEPGRLVFFLSETLHSVTEVLAGRRAVL